jgi:adenylate cyclase
LPEEKRALEQRATTNVKAYKFYLMARQFSVMGNERHQEIIVRLCKRAVELDPSYAAPWATMAIAQWDMHRRSASDDDGEAAAHEAIRWTRDWPTRMPHWGPRYRALALRGGPRVCESALRLDPESYEGNRIAGMCSMALHRFDDAIRYFEAAANSVDTDFVAASFAMQNVRGQGRHGRIAGRGRRRSCASRR